MIHLTRFSIFALIAAFVAQTPAVAADESGVSNVQNCFTEADNTRLTFAVLHQAPAPAQLDRSYKFYPMTGVASMQLASLTAAQTGYALYYFQWANRSNAPLLNARGQQLPRKLNFQQSTSGVRRQRTGFSSVLRANACTLAQAANALGLPADVSRYATAGDIRIARESMQPDNGPAGPTDLCVIADHELPRQAAGMLLDYEVQDRRSSGETLAFLTEYAGLVHRAGRKVILLTNPLDAPSQAYTGINGQIAHAIVSLFDYTTIFLWSGNREHDLHASYTAQKALIEAGGAFEGSRILIDFELAGTTLADARLTRKLIVEDQLAGVLFWRNYAKQGGICSSDVNQKIATIAFGHVK